MDVVFSGSFQVHPRALKPLTRALYPRFPYPCSRQRISSAMHVSVCMRRTQRASSALDFWRARSVGMGYACMHALGVCGTLALPRTRIRVAARRRTGPMGRFWRSVLLCRARSLHVASACAGMPDARRRPLAAPLSGSALAMSSRRRVHPDMCEGAQHAYLHGSIFCF